jgi:hypothetical protein
VSGGYPVVLVRRKREGGKEMFGQSDDFFKFGLSHREKYHIARMILLSKEYVPVFGA